MFGGHWSGGSGNITYLFCHVNSKDQVIEGSYGLMLVSAIFYQIFIFQQMIILQKL